MSDHDTSMLDEAACPYCAHGHSQAELCDRNACSEDSREVTCDSCGKDFTVVGSVSWHFSTFKVSDRRPV